jgi:response regulator of citrate/malate metabolism
MIQIKRFEKDLTQLFERKSKVSSQKKKKQTSPDHLMQVQD